MIYNFVVEICIREKNKAYIKYTIRRIFYGREDY